MGTDSVALEYLPPTMVPIFCTDEDQADGLLEANSYTGNIASSITYEK